MAYGFGNRTITDGLVFCLDAANPASYQTNTSYWKSIAKDSSIGYFTGDTYFDSNYYEKKVIRFDGADDYIVGQSPDRLLNVNNTGDITVQVFFSVRDPQTKKTIFCAAADNDTYAHYGIGVSQAGGDESIYAYIFSGAAEESIDTNILIDNSRHPYRMLTVSFGTSHAVYFDNTYITDHSITISGNPFGNYWFLATEPTRTSFFDGDIHTIRVYNRVLSASEISNNYDFYIQRN
jgi:hypothetical protein